MGLHVPDVSGPDSSGFNYRLAQEPPGSMPGAGAANFRHPGAGAAQVQAEEIALLIFLVMISAGVMLLTESARRHEHAMPRTRTPAAAHHHDHHHRWRRFGVVAAVLALLLILGLLLYPMMLKGG